MDVLDLPTGATATRRTEAARARSRPLLMRSLLLVVCGVAVVGASRVGDPELYLRADPELARLLRAMALLKAAMVVAALAGLLWRFHWPVSFTLGSAYASGSALAVGACVMIWNLEHVATAAVLFHVGGAILIAGALLDRSGSRGPQQRPGGNIEVPVEHRDPLDAR